VGLECEVSVGIVEAYTGAKRAGLSAR
jgi:hypothetical protein